jgi:ABC-type polysaccharide/polyol phosphate export permease
MTAQQSSDVGVTVRTPPGKWWSAIRVRSREIFGYQALIANLAKRDLAARYKRSVLGWAWSLINPIARLAIYSLVFGQFLRIVPPVAGNGELENFAVYLFCALVVWNIFEGIIVGSMTSLVGAGPLLNKVYFPPESPGIANVLVVSNQSIFEFGVLVLVLVALGNVSWTFFFWPYIFVMAILLAFGIGLAVSVYNVFYRDVGYLVGIILQFLFYAVPIIYPFGLIPDEAWGLPVVELIKLNPLAQLTEMSRDVLYDLELPSALRIAYTTCACVTIFIVGWFIFVRKTANIAEEL